MRIAVLLKAPRATPGSDARLIGLAPCDLAALNTALALADQDESTRITALTAGPEADEQPLEQALRRGAHEAVRVWIDGVEQKRSGDEGIIARLLAAALEQIAPDLILSGTRSSDQGSGMTGPTIAHALGLPHFSQVTRAARLDPRRIRATQRRVGGDITVTLPLPALLTISAADSRSAVTPDRSAPTIRHLDAESLDFDADEALSLRPAPTLQPSNRKPTMLGGARELAECLEALLGSA